MKKFLPIVLSLVLMVSLPLAVFAAWATSPTVNNPISTAAGNQQNPQIIADGSGGAIITWQDRRSGDYDIYAQRVNSAGSVQWTDNGTAIASAADEQENPQIIAHGSGGAIITWEDCRSGTDDDIYAQRVNGSGEVQWTANGIAISSALNSQYAPQLVSDNASGAIITWWDCRSGTSYDIYAQRVNASGVGQWTDNGTAITTAASEQYSPQLVADGAGGAIITWHDNRSGTNWDIYAQRVNASGAVQWTDNGTAIAVAAEQQIYPQLVADGSGGAIITWYDNRSGTSYDIYVQRVNGSGVGQWTANGVAISTAASEQENPQIIADGSAGAIITWQDYRSGTNYDIYAQRVLSSGILGDPPPDILVGVAVYPPDKLALLAPWLVLAVIVGLAAAGSILAVRRRRAH